MRGTLPRKHVDENPASVVRAARIARAIREVLPTAPDAPPGAWSHALRKAGRILSEGGFGDLIYDEEQREQLRFAAPPIRGDRGISAAAWLNPNELRAATENFAVSWWGAEFYIGAIACLAHLRDGEDFAKTVYILERAAEQMQLAPEKMRAGQLQIESAAKALSDPLLQMIADDDTQPKKLQRAAVAIRKHLEQIGKLTSAIESELSFFSFIDLRPPPTLRVAENRFRSELVRQAYELMPALPLKATPWACFAIAVGLDEVPADKDELQSLHRPRWEQALRGARVK